MEEFIRKVFIKKKANLTVQFFRYTLIGAVAAVVDVLIYHIAAVDFGINPVLSNTISFVFGVLANYFMSREWIFSRSNHKFARDFSIFIITGIVGLLIGNILLFVFLNFGLLYRVLATFKDHYVKDIAKVIVIGVVFMWNFISRKLLVFDDVKG